MSPADPGSGAPLPPKPDFSPADIQGNLAEARQLRLIGMGQPIKASWLCRETLDIYRRHGLAPDLDLVDGLRVLTLTYTDAIKRGQVVYGAFADDAMDELSALGGIPDAAEIQRRCQREPSWDPAARLSAWRIRVPGGDAATIESPHIRFPLARVPRSALPLDPDAEGCVEPGSLPGAEILVASPVRLQARYECLYLHGLVHMSQALRIERSSQQSGPSRLQQELSYLIEAAWWFHLSCLVAAQAPVNPAECHRRARAKLSTLIRRIETGKHFEMPTLEFVDLLE